MATAEAAAVEKCNGQELDGRRRSRWPSPRARAAASAVAVAVRRPAHHASDGVQHPGESILALADRELCGLDGRESHEGFPTIAAALAQGTRRLIEMNVVDRSAPVRLRSTSYLKGR